MQNQVKLQEVTAQESSPLQRYYQLVKKGNSPELTRKDLGLDLDDIAKFDFSIFADSLD